eukprot:3352132-Pleurochrysis_carterae.AAC.1
MLAALHIEELSLKDAVVAACSSDARKREGSRSQIESSASNSSANIFGAILPLHRHAACR